MSRAASSTNVLGASRSGILSASQYLALILGTGVFLVVVMVLAIVVPLKTSKAHFPHTAPLPTAAPTLAPTTAGPPTTHAPTLAPAPYPALALTCPPPAVVPIGAPLTVPPQAVADINGTGCPPIALSYVDAQYSLSQLVQLSDYVNIDLDAAGVVKQPGVPLDTVLDASNAHIVAALVNGTTGGAAVFVYNLTTPGAGLPLLASFSMASLGISPLGGSGGPCAQAPGGSPQVQYDHIAQQWLLMQVTAPPYNSLCLYVSSTSDPVASAWRLYQFVAPQYPSQPKLALFGDLYLVTTVEPAPLGPGGGPGAVVYFIERQPVLNFELNTRFFRTVVPLAALAGPGPLVVAPVDNEAGPQPLYATAQGGAFVMRAVDDELYVVNATVGTDWLDVFHYSNIDFALGSFALTYTRIAVPEFNSTTCDTGCVLQAGHLLLPSLRLPLSHRLVYRQIPAQGNTTSFTQSIVGALYTIPVGGGGGSGVYWFELRAVNNGPVWALYQTDVARFSGGMASSWTSSVSMNGQGSIAIAFSRSGPGQYLATVALGRVATDPLNTTSEVSTGLGEPNGVYIEDVNSWGRYRAMSVTPDSNATVGGAFVTINQYAQDGVRISVLRNAPLHMERTWSANDACLVTQMCTQVFTS